MRVTVKLVESDQVIENQSGGSYTGTLITYSVGGKTYTKAIANKFLDNPRAADFRDKLDDLAANVPKEVVFKLVEKEVGGRTFKNLVDIVEVGSEEDKQYEREKRTSNGTAPETGVRSTTSASKQQGSFDSVTKKDLTIARAVGIKVAGTVSTTGNIFEVTELADTFGNYILAPYGVDVNGKPVAKVVKREIVEDDE